MAHTNSTSNYHLPQFVGSDKPAWLTDVNGAMADIDAQMKANADAGSVNAGKIATAEGNITDLQSAVQQQGVQLQTVAGVASTASTKAEQAKTVADAVKEYFALDTFVNLTWTATSGSVGNITYYTPTQCARNNDGSLGKVYGHMYFKVTSSTGVTLRSSDTGLRPAQRLTINGFATRCGEGGTPALQSVVFNTDGTIETTLSSAWYNSNVTLLFMNSLLFITDFGDIEQE